ncbi:uncharacterized protein [Dermacentor albipictus]|uniref:uncharacterized protein n=1 Tax=Dermacentor albipictus TaxID=60249 RepID=UPI0031FD360F
MGPAKLLVLFAFFSTSCAAMFYRTDDPCDFTDIHLDDEMFSTLLAKLPEGLEYGSQRFRYVLPGIEVGGMTVHGLSKLRQFGPAIPYCSKGKRMVQVDFYNTQPIDFISPWMACSDDKGKLSLSAEHTRFTAQFIIAESSGEGVKLEFERALPVTTQNIRVVLEGLGDGVGVFFEALSALIPSLLEGAWNAQFSHNLEKAFRMALE